MTRVSHHISILLFFFSALAAHGKCVQIYYDKAPQAKPVFSMGRVHALYLQNLLGHFPEYQQYIIPIEMYEEGQIHRCEATIYLGMYYNNDIPETFLQDWQETDRNVLWAGYNFWKLGPEFIQSTWGVKFVGISELDKSSTDPSRKPDFFKFYDYKGETFNKFGDWDYANPKKFNAAFEISLFELENNAAEKNVVAWARHSRTNKKVPYILNHGNFWYVGDSPFSFITEEDRYLIFADILFDLLQEKPRHQGKPRALFRMEDIHARVALWQLYMMTDLIAKFNLPFSMTLIPIFSDPYATMGLKPEDKFVPLTRNQLFVEYLHYAETKRASFIYHGVTHQAGMKRNPWTGMTGDDFEFWDRVKNRPIAEDSPKFVINRIEEGLELLDEAKIAPIAWLPPHYQASPLDYLIFGQLFTWNVGRVIYFPYQSTQKTPLPEALRIDASGISANGKRLPYFQDLKVTYDENQLPNGQFFPYEIDGDVFGQRLIPENVGNVQPYLNEQVLRHVSIDDLIRIMRRNRVLRDAWASFFVHPFEIEDTTQEGTGSFPGDTREIARLIQAALDAGYEFIDLKQWIKGNTRAIRPNPIEIGGNT